jgi:hypothetical protein
MDIEMIKQRLRELNRMGRDDSVSDEMMIEAEQRFRSELRPFGLVVRYPLGQSQDLKGFGIFVDEAGE